MHLRSQQIPLFLFGVSVVFLMGCGMRQAGPSEDALPDPWHHRECFSGGAFLPADIQDVADALPAGFAPLDGAEVGSSFAGKALLGLAAWSCPASGEAEKHSFALIVSLVQPPVEGETFDSVHLHWYEHARIVDSDELYRTWRAAGLDVARGQFQYEPFSPGQDVAEIAGVLGTEEIFRIRTELNHSVDFPGQTLAFWQTTPERLVYSLFRFEPHRSWLGDLSECAVEFEGVVAASLEDVRCPDHGLTEVIESIDFVSSVNAVVLPRR